MKHGDIALGLRQIQDEMTRTALWMGIVAEKVAQNDITPALIGQVRQVLQSHDAVADQLDWVKSVAARLVNQTGS